MGTSRRPMHGITSATVFSQINCDVGYAGSRSVDCCATGQSLVSASCPQCKYRCNFGQHRCVLTTCVTVELYTPAFTNQSCQLLACSVRAVFSPHIGYGTELKPQPNASSHVSEPHVFFTIHGMQISCNVQYIVTVTEKWQECLSTHL